MKMGRNPATSFLGTMPGGAGAMAVMSDSLHADTRFVAAIYYLVLMDATIYLIFVYDKGEADDLTADQKKNLKALAQVIAEQHGRK